jgi:hypothetical protein
VGVDTVGGLRGELRACDREADVVRIEERRRRPPNWLLVVGS